MTQTQTRLKTAVAQILDDNHSDRIYTVEDGTVWVSGMNANAGHVAESMVTTLMSNDIACSLTRHDDADLNGGVEFDYGRVD